MPPEDPVSNALMARRELTDYVAARLIAPDTASTHSTGCAHQRLLESEFVGGPELVLLESAWMGTPSRCSRGPLRSTSVSPDTLPIGRRHERLAYVSTAPVVHQSRHIVLLVSRAAKLP